MKRIRGVLIWSVASLFGALGFTNLAGAQSTPAPYLTAYRYQDGGLLTGTISPAPSGQSGFLATRNTYDTNGRLQKVETGVLASWPSDPPLPADPIQPANWSGFCVAKAVTFSYDAYGRKAAESVFGASNCVINAVATDVTQFSYDVFNRLTCTAVRMNPAAFGSLPDACYLGTTGANGPDRITANTYDSLNRLTHVANGVGTSDAQAYADYTYTADGLRKTIVDANNNRSLLSYDGFDRLADWYFPAPTGTGATSSTDYEQYGYDPNGNRTSLKKRSGQTITYQFDALNRMSHKALPGGVGDVYYGYDLRGLPTSALFASGSGVSNQYDGFGRLRSTTTNMGGFSRTIGHTYDADGDRTGVTHPDNNSFTYSYDGVDRLTGLVENNGAAIVSQAYNSFGLRSNQTRAGVASSYGYDPAERIQNFTDNLSGTGPDVSTTLGYNAANQIITHARDNDTYAFTEYTNGSTSYTVNNLNQYVSVGGTSYGYDTNANLTSDGTNSYTYDVENRLITATSAGQTGDAHL